MLGDDYGGFIDNAPAVRKNDMLLGLVPAVLKNDMLLGLAPAVGNSLIP